jgi:peptide/nickel transport system substrate-binding protein
MQGLAYPTNNIVFDNGEGFLPDLEKVKADPAKAKQLLAEAGYPDGFKLTLASPNDRMINDEKVIQAIAQMLTRIGIDAQVDAMPFTVVNTRGGKGEFAAVMMSWGTTLEASVPIRTLVACTNAEKGWGPVNWSNYCNPKLDEILAQAMSTVDTPARVKLLDEAVQIVHDDQAIVPLYFQGATWAARKGISITPRADERTMPVMFTPQD